MIPRKPGRRRLAPELILLAILASASAGFQRIPPPASPEILEIQAAVRIADPAARLKELERIKAAYPRSPQLGRIEGWILSARIDLAGTVEAVVSLQKNFAPYDAAARLLRHPRLASFDKNKVLAAVLDYRRKAAESGSGAAESAPANQAFDLLVSKARAAAGDGAGALAALERYKASGGESQAEYFSALGDAYTASGRTEDAVGAYLGAALDHYPGAEEKARAAYSAIHGSAAGFEARLDSLRASLPFTPKPFTPPRDWKGKTVLAELFTSSESPSSLGPDLAFAGLSRAFPPQFLVVLEYHLDLQGPDPMTGPAAARRRDYYRIRRIPTAIIDGERIFIGGGDRRWSATLFNQYRAAVEECVIEGPVWPLEVEAAREGDAVTVNFTVKKYLPGAAVFAALAEDEVAYKGASGTIIHRLVVRDLTERDPAASGKAVFNLTSAQRTADGGDLSVVVFVQDKDSRKVLNAAIVIIK